MSFITLLVNILVLYGSILYNTGTQAAATNSGYERVMFTEYLVTELFNQVIDGRRLYATAGSHNQDYKVCTTCLSVFVFRPSQNCNFGSTRCSECVIRIRSSTVEGAMHDLKKMGPKESLAFVARNISNQESTECVEIDAYKTLSASKQI